MLMKRYISRLVALVLVVAIGLMGCSSTSVSGLSGDYRQDTLTLLQNLRTAIELPEGTPDKAEAQSNARQAINEFASRYRRDSSVTDVVLVDPPRAGLEKQVVDGLLRSGPKMIAYVSCDPSTLARDAARLIGGGYRLKQVTPFDLFPQTFHIESISIFEK